MHREDQGRVRCGGKQKRRRVPRRTGQFSRIFISLIAEARTHAKQFGIDDEFRVNLKHAGEMHDLLIEALIENEPLSTEYLRGVAVSADNAIA